MTDTDKAAALIANVDKLPPHNRDFATSLATQLKQRGSLSEKQWPHFDRLYKLATETPAPVAAAERFPRVLDLFARKVAKAEADAASDGEGLEFARLILSTDGGKDADGVPQRGFMFRMHKSTSGRHPGTIQVKEYVKREADYYGANHSDAFWFGRIGLDGTWSPSWNEHPRTADVMATLREIEADPNAAMVVQGQRTGQCCACGRKLTNEISRKLGIGPICRGRLGL